ncbi:MAG: hypothetical protein C0505_07810 [Leptothrix sp. (in: Bacteria)]|nr:hypothetical protein [Leptothrix sp. (in: b-proteobacteria)]
MDTAVKSIDVRTVPPVQRHALIFGTFDALATGQALEIVNDHDPVPLRHQFSQTRTGQFDWKYLQAGPALWHVRVARVADGMPGGITTGCGGSGGCSCSG